MKTKIFLLILIFGAGYLVWGLFINNFSQEPIEIIANPSSDNPTLEKVASLEVIESTEDASEELENNDDAIHQPPVGGGGEEEIKEEEEEEEEEALENKDSSFIINKKTNWGYSSAEGRIIDTIVIHSSYDALGSEPYNLEGLIAEYKQYSVAPHFLIDRKGNIYRLVEEKNIAYHAGVSETPDGRTEVNNFSIGIELMNTKTDAYTDKQYSGLNSLLDYLENQYKIKYVLGHTAIAPTRKTDPWNFDWKEINSSKSIHD